MSLRHKIFIAVCAAALALGASGDAFARAGSGGSFGSRGARTYSMPSPTATAPNMASPIERSMTPNSNVFRPSPMQPRGGFFSGGFGRGLLGGFLGAGLFGLLFGHGLFGGIGGGGSIIGLLIQLAILYFGVKFAMNFFRRQQQPAYQGAAYSPAPGQGGGGPFGGFSGAGGAPTRPLSVVPADFSTFEQRLSEVQAAFSREDLDAVRRIVTPEMASYFAEEIAGNARKGVVNRVDNVKLLRGDLSEAWSEPPQDYATVAMRYSLTDTMVDRASNRVVSGDPARPDEVTELWTFTRPSGGGSSDWKLSAIQQS